MATFPLAFPSRFAAGTTLNVERSFSDYSATAGWTAKLYMNGLSEIAPVVGIAQGSGFRFTVPAIVTGILQAGDYVYKVIVTDGTVVLVAESGAIRIDPNIATALAGALQSQAEKWLQIAVAAIEGRLTADQQAYQIAGRAVTKIPIMEWWEIRARCESEIAQKRASAGGRFGRTVRSTFTGVEYET